MSTLQKAINGQRAELALGGKPILGVRVLNPTAAFLYFSTSDTPSATDNLFVCDPYTLMTVPVMVPERLYVRDGAQVAPLDANSRAIVSAEPEALPLARVSTTRSLTYRVAVKAALAAGGARFDFGDGVQANMGQRYSLPSYSGVVRRTLYVTLAAGTITGGAVYSVLEGQRARVAALPTGQQSATLELSGAVGQALEIEVIPSAATTVDIRVQVDI